MRTRLRAAAAVLFVPILATGALAACGNDDAGIAPAGESTSSADAAAADEQALVTLAENVWTAREEAGRESDPDRSRFEALLSRDLIERETSTLQQYEKLGVTRKGAPVVTDIEAKADGDTGRVLMCLNEDDWVGYEKGRKIKGAKLGTVPFGFDAAREGDRWQVTAFLPSAESTKDKTC